MGTRKPAGRSYPPGLPLVQRSCSGLAEAVNRGSQPRDLARGGLLREGALACGLRDRDARFGEGLGRGRRILRSDRSAHGLDVRSNRALDAAVAQCALLSLTVAFLGGRMIGHGLSSISEEGGNLEGARSLSSGPG